MIWIWGALGGYLLIVLVMFLAQRNLIYPASAVAPRLTDHNLPGLEAVKTDTHPGLTLTHWFHAPRDSEAPLIVFFHGNASDLSSAVAKMRPFVDAGFGLLATGYRGYSGNPGRPNEEGLTADARSVIDWAHHQGYEADRLVYFGESLGTAVAVKMASELPPSALVLEAPPSSIVDVAAAHYWYLPVRPLIRDPWDSHSRIHTIRCPLLILHGESDPVVPVRFGRKLFDAAIEPKEAIWHPTAQHTDILDDPAVVRQVIDFINMR